MSGFAHDLAGGSGNLIIASFQSPNFVAGSAGWQVTITGDAEFNSVTVRGEIIATDFEAEIIVAAGPYAGTYTIATGQITDPGTGDVLAGISWTNTDSPPYLAPYLAAVSAQATGAITSLHSGMADSGDSDAAIWLLSGRENGGAPLFLADAEELQLFGSSGPVLFQSGGGFAVDTWHPMTLLNSWAKGSSPNVQPQYRYTPENEVEVIGTIIGTSATAITFATLPSGYQPASQQMIPAQGTSATAGNYFIQIGASGSMSLQGPARNGTYVFHGFVSLDA